MSREGVGHQEIARTFHLSRSGIDIIVRRFEEERQLTEKSARFLKDVRQADDLNVTWPTVDLIEAIGPLPVTRTRLKNHFQERNADRISLRDLMDMAIPEEHAQEPGCRYPPLMQVCGVFSKGYWSVVNRMTDLDLGERCNRQWEQRLARLRRVVKIKGPFPY